MSELKFPIILSLFLGVLAANGNFLGRISNLWSSPYHSPPPPPPPPGGDSEEASSSVIGSARGNGGGFSGKSFASRGGYNDYGGGGDPYMMSASQRGWGGGGWGWDNDHQNLDLYSLLGGLSFASLLGATIIYLARRNTSGRRRRSADGLSYLEDDEMDFSEDPQTKGLNIVELIDTFLDNPAIFSGISSDSGGNNNETTVTGSRNDNISMSSKSSTSSNKVNLGPGVVPYELPSSKAHHFHENSVH